MNTIHKRSIDILEDTIRKAEEYVDYLQFLKPSDKNNKILKKSYYTFASDLIQNTNSNESLMSEITLSIYKTDSINEDIQTQIFGKYFDNCVLFRTILEEYLQINERMVSAQTLPFPVKDIIKQTDIFIRKLTALKNSHYNLQN